MVCLGVGGCECGEDGVGAGVSGVEGGDGGEGEDEDGEFGIGEVGVVEGGLGCCAVEVG